MKADIVATTRAECARHSRQAADDALRRNSHETVHVVQRRVNARLAAFTVVLLPAR